MAPEVFRGHYTEKADVFSLDAIFFAILERDFIVINGKAFYGAFKHIPSVGKLGLGHAMAMYDPNTRVAFSIRAQGEPLFKILALNALRYNDHDRLGAGEIHSVFEEAVVWINEYLRAYFTIILALVGELL